MEAVLHQDMLLPPGRSDYSGGMSLEGCAELFQNIATDHAVILGMGLNAPNMKNKFWIATKTRIEILRKPGYAEEIRVTTWPETKEAVAWNRSYQITHGDEVLAVGKTQWAVVDTETGRLVNPNTCAPEDFEAQEGTAIDEPYFRVKKLAEGVKIGEYVVRSTDIDLGNHMNNVAYIRAFRGLFSVEEQKAMNIHSLEIHYKNACFEGDRIVFEKTEADGVDIYNLTVDGANKAYIIIRK